MTPDAAVACLAKIVAQRATFEEEDIYEAMSKVGVPDAVADRAYKFAQIAWGRAFLAGLGARLSPDYLGFNSAGEVIEAGRLEEEAYFAAASRLAQRYARSPGFREFVLMDSDVKAINARLLAGSKAEDLVRGPVGVFLEAATPAGLEKAKQIILQAAFRTAGKDSRAWKKPWWRFWG